MQVLNQDMATHVSGGMSSIITWSGIGLETLTSLFFAVAAFDEDEDHKFGLIMLAVGFGADAMTRIYKQLSE